MGTLPNAPHPAQLSRITERGGLGVAVWAGSSGWRSSSLTRMHLAGQGNGSVAFGSRDSGALGPRCAYLLQVSYQCAISV